MHLRLVGSLALLAVLPAMAVAQRGGGSKATTRPSDLPTTPQVRYPTVRDIDEHNPASLLVDKRRKLALADSAVNQLKALEKTFKDRNAQTVAMYDSVRRRITSSLAQGVSELTPGLQMEDQQNKLGMRNLWADLRGRIEKDGQEALALVPEDKKKDASVLLKEHLDDFDKLMPGGRGRS